MCALFCVASSLCPSIGEIAFSNKSPYRNFPPVLEKLIVVVKNLYRDFLLVCERNLLLSVIISGIIGASLAHLFGGYIMLFLTISALIIIYLSFGFIILMSESHFEQ